MTTLVPRALARAPRVLAAGVAAAAAVALLQPASPAAAAGAPIPASYFGVHHAGLHSAGAVGWPQAPVGAVRIWDNGVSWREVESAPGQFDFSRLDAIVGKARANGAAVLLVLGQTPRFHATKPAAKSAYGPGASSMPKKAAWVRYVKTLARHNATQWGGVAQFQVWNEANVSTYWSGTQKQMATLTAWTDKALRSAAPRAKLVGPAMVTRLTSQRAWINSFYGQRVGGKNVSKYVDALSFQLYPEAKGSPESSMKLLAAVRAILNRHRVSKPIYNTEVNYGLVGGPQAGARARKITSTKQVGNVVRTYVLNAQNRVARVYWYSWDLLGISNTPLVQGDRVTLTPAGRAFAATRGWMLGTKPAGCKTDRKGTYTCLFTKGGKKLRAVWNPRKNVAVKTPKGTQSHASWNGTGYTTGRGKTVKVGPIPVLLRGTR